MVVQHQLVSVVVGLLLLLGSGSVDGKVIDYEYKTTMYDAPFTEVTKYAFSQGGSLDLEIKYEELKKTQSGKVTLIICEEDKYELFTQVLLLSEECEHLESFRRCFHFAILKTNKYNITSKVDVAGTYHFLVANCDRLTLAVSVKGQLINGDGFQLDVATKPLLSVYPILSVVWFIFFLIYGINSLMYFRYAKIPLHKFLTFSALFKSTCMLACYQYWSSMSQSGFPLLSISILYYFMHSMWVALLFTTLLLISKGWCITRFSFTWIEVRSIMVVVIMVVIAYLMSKLGNQYYLFGYGVLFIITMKYVFSSLAYNIRSLNVQLQLVVYFSLQRDIQHVVQQRDNNAPTRASGHTPIDTGPLNDKLHLFKRLQMIMVTYLFFSVLKLICERYFFSDLVWCIVFFDESLEVVSLGLGLGYLFRLRNFKKDDEQTDPSMIIDEKPRTKGPRRSPLIVIQNPPTLIGPKGKINYYNNAPLIYPSIKFGTLSNCDIFTNTSAIVATEEEE